VISVETRGQVAVVTMTHGRANALDTGLCRALAGRLGELERDGHRAVVLTGHGNIFSAGVDLLALRDGGPGYLEEFLPALSEAFLAVFTCPLPVVAAVNGHAIAGGCVLACACDHRVMNAGHGRIGVTELLVGPVPGGRDRDPALRGRHPAAQGDQLLGPDVSRRRGRGPRAGGRGG
jgi:enoyl-CoA hydratase